MVDLSMRHLRALSYRFPTPEAALSEIAHLEALLTLPRGTVHVLSDVHGEFRKLDHILRNGSGSLRPLVDRVFEHRLDAAERQQLLNVIYYPRQTFRRVMRELHGPAREAFVFDTLSRQLELLRALASRFSLRHTERSFPVAWAKLLTELLNAPTLARGTDYVRALLAPFFAHDEALELLRAVSHTLQTFTTYELIVAGDLGDRGPRIDRVIESLHHQQNLTITWGNHDAEWMGACLGQEALIMTVLRLSLRSGRLSQLEEGYGIPLEPLEQLANSVYANDPAQRFTSKGEDLRDALTLARMHKAAAIMQFKLEGQTIQRNPSFELDARLLLHRLDLEAGVVTIDGQRYELLDRSFPTVDPAAPYQLSEAEARCLARLKQAFLDSSTLWRDMRFVADRGSMTAVRDEMIVFHACLPSDPNGTFKPMLVDGVPRSGRALCNALDQVVRRAFRCAEPADLDLLYYLWAGPKSPLFGKDRMATFETYFVAEKSTHVETKDPYFQLIHQVDYCQKVAREFDVDPERVLIVNGHVPVKLEAGESPLKQSGLAVTIDGAFSEAYGDHGYTLVWGAEGVLLAKHHHFESVEGAIERGADIVPQMQRLRTNATPRTIGETPRGAALREEIADLHRLVLGYRNHELEAPAV